MLTIKDLDLMMQDIQAGNKVYLYYVAHAIEPREGFLDVEIYKSVSRFRVIKIEVTNITNAYWEYLNFKKYPEDYHVEVEEEYYGYDAEMYMHFYTVPNGPELYDRSFTPNMPSIIYGRRKQVFRNGEFIKEINDPSPVKEIYTNTLEYGNLKGDDIKAEFNNSNLDWKYIELENTEKVDGIDYKYVTSDWYILDIKNFPRTEKVLINVDNISAYFRDISDAFYFIDQLVA